MDWRVLVVLLPLAIAAGWAGFNILSFAIRQAQQFMSKET